jgi:glycosyl transferase family 25
MKVFVINLARSTERRASIEQQPSHLNLDDEITEAVDGSQLSYSDIMREMRLLNYALSCGEVGCALSHIGIYRKAASFLPPPHRFIYQRHPCALSKRM